MSKSKDSKALSMLGSVIGVSVVLAILIYKDDNLRAEAKNQLSNLLRTTKKLLHRYNRFSIRSDVSVYTRKINDKERVSDQPDVQPYDEAYVNAWSLVEDKMRN